MQQPTVGRIVLFCGDLGYGNHEEMAAIVAHHYGAGVVDLHVLVPRSPSPIVFVPGVMSCEDHQVAEKGCWRWPPRT